jgi:hypothetical protein
MISSKFFHMKCKMLPHCNIHKYTKTYPDGKMQNHIGHVLIDERRH